MLVSPLPAVHGEEAHRLRHCSGGCSQRGQHYASQSTVCRRAVRTRRGKEEIDTLEKERKRGTERDRKREKERERRFVVGCPQIFAGTAAISPHRRWPTLNADVSRRQKADLPSYPARPGLTNERTPSPSLLSRTEPLPAVLAAPRRFPSIDRIRPAKFPLACAVVAAGSGSRA